MSNILRFDSRITPGNPLSPQSFVSLYTLQKKVRTGNSRYEYQRNWFFLVGKWPLFYRILVCKLPGILSRAKMALAFPFAVFLCFDVSPKW